MPRRAFTLIELLVVVAVVAVLVGLLLPALSGVRQSARNLKCVVQVRQLEMAHRLYADEHKGMFVDAGLSHGGVLDVERSWPVVLEAYHGSELGLRSPTDTSRFWPVEQGGEHEGLSYREVLELVRAGRGDEVSGPNAIARWTSYGLNGYTARSVAPSIRETFDRDQLIDVPSATAHFVLMTTGNAAGTEGFARADHVHPNDWANGPGGAASAPLIASRQMESNAHGGGRGSREAKAGYGFLDGHAETQAFSRVYVDEERNRFDARVAR